MAKSHKPSPPWESSRRMKGSKKLSARRKQSRKADAARKPTSSAIKQASRKSKPSRKSTLSRKSTSSDKSIPSHTAVAPAKQKAPTQRGHGFAVGWIFPADQTKASGCWCILETGDRVQLASPLSRLIAYMIDMVMCTVALFVIYILFMLAGNGEHSIFMILAMMIGAMTCCYIAIALTAVTGQTIGRKATQARIIRIKDGEAPGWNKAFLRWAVHACLSCVPFINPLYLCPLLADNDRRGWHDKAAGTIVVKT